MGENKIQPIAIAKFSEKIYLEDIIENEELFFNTISYFSIKGKEDDRFDQYEGFDRIYQPSYIVDLQLDGRSYNIVDSGIPIKMKTSIDPFTYFTNKIIKQKNERKVFNPKLFFFGNYFVIGTEIKTIFEIIDSACKADKNIVNYKMGPVSYSDIKKHNGEWDVFHKPLKFKYQNEVRIAIKINSNDPYRLKIPGLRECILGLVSQDECINKIIDDVAIISEKKVNNRIK